jgi:hypothetical protein
MAAIEAWGLEATLQRCAGMFALVLWDLQDRLLHLARGRFGEKPPPSHAQLGPISQGLPTALDWLAEESESSSVAPKPCCTYLRTTVQRLEQAGAGGVVGVIRKHSGLERAVKSIFFGLNLCVYAHKPLPLASVPWMGAPPSFVNGFRWRCPAVNAAASCLNCNVRRSRCCRSPRSWPA